MLKILKGRHYPESIGFRDKQSQDYPEIQLATVIPHVL